MIHLHIAALIAIAISSGSVGLVTGALLGTRAAEEQRFRLARLAEEWARTADFVPPDSDRYGLDTDAFSRGKRQQLRSCTQALISALKE